MDTMGGEDSYGEDDYGEKRAFGDLEDDDKIDVNMDDLPDDDSEDDIDLSKKKD